MVKNYCIKFIKRPGVDGTPCEDNFVYEECNYSPLNEESDEDVNNFIQ